MADGWGVNDANALVIGLPSIGILEKTGTIAKKNGHNMDVHFVDQAGREVLPGDIRTAAQIDVFPPGRVFGLLQRRVDALSQKVKNCFALHFKRIAGVMRQHEDLRMKGGLSPHQPFHGLFPQGPSPPPNMCRPIMVAPMF